MQDRIILLGTKGGPAIRRGGAMPTSTLLQLGGKIILIDCGIGVSRSLVDTGIALLDLDAIFITHLHSDHVIELGPLIYTIWTTGLNRNLSIYGPKGTSAYWQTFLSAMDYDHSIRLEDEGRRDTADMIEINTIDDFWTLAIDDVRVKALRVDHPPVTDCFALKFEYGGKSAVFSADTCYYPPLADFAASADILVHEAMLTGGIDRLVARTASASRLREHLVASHTAAEDVGRIASMAKVGTLVLNHLIPADDEEFGEADWQREIRQTWDGPLIVGRDGLTIPIDQ